MEHPLLFAIAAFLMLMVLISWVGYRLIYKPGKFMRQLGRPVITSGTVVGEPEVEGSTLVTFLKSVGSRVPTSPRIIRPSSRGSYAASSRRWSS